MAYSRVIFTFTFTLSHNSAPVSDPTTCIRVNHLHRLLYIYYLQYELPIITVMWLKIQIRWKVKPCRLVIIDGRFEGRSPFKTSTSMHLFSYDRHIVTCITVCLVFTLSYTKASHIKSASHQPNVMFNLLNHTGHVMHQQFNIQQLYVLPTLYLCILYLSENKQRLVPLTS